jgi:hypothetical protein
MNDAFVRRHGSSQKTRLRKVVIASSVGIVVSLSACGSEASAQNTAEGSVVINVKDWTAAGSGCRAKQATGGDVTYQGTTPLSASDSQLSIMRFSLPDYGLVSPPENPATSLTFARECALRIVAVPQKGFRIKSVAARTPVQYSKAEQTKLKMQYMLRLDGEIIAHKLTEIDDAAAFRDRQDTPILAGERAPWESAAVLDSCGAPQMVGFDYTFIASRKSATDSASIRLSNDKSLELAVEVEACQ